MTLTRIAALAGTAPSTVSRVLSNDPRISEATRERILALLATHDYQPNLFARALKGGRTGQIGVLSSSIGSGFFAEVLQGIDQTTKTRDTHVLCSFAHGTDDYLKLARDLLTSGRTDGLILIDPPLELYDQSIPARATPAVLCASRALRRGSAWRAIDSVTVDSRDVMRRLVDHAVEQGSRRLVHLAGPRNTYDAQARRSAFAEATVLRRGLRAFIMDGHLIESDGRRTAERLLRRSRSFPDVLVCFNDSTAQGVLQALKNAGRDWMGRIGVSGWDDSPASTFLDLTSVSMPTNDVGKKAAELLLDRLGADQSKIKARHVELPASVLVRASTLLTGRQRS